MSRACWRGGIAVAFSFVMFALSPTLLRSQTTPEGTLAVRIAQATSIVDNVSARAASGANELVFGAAARLQLLIETFRDAAPDISASGPRELDDSQRGMFANIQTGVAALQIASNGPQEQAQARIDEIRRLTNDQAFAMDGPVVVHTSPAILAPSGLDPILFTIAGQQLASADPRLSFGDVEAVRIDLTERQATFALPAGALRSSETAPIRYSGLLRLAVRRCRWKLHCQATLRTYTVGVVMLPARVARVQISFDRKRTQRIYDSESAVGSAPGAVAGERLYSRLFAHSASELSLMSCTRKSQLAHAPGYSIDTATLATRVAGRRGENQWRLLDATPDGFTLELCAQPQINGLATYAGSISIETTWKEYRMGEVVLPRESVAARELNWGLPVEEALPPDSDSIGVELDFFDGSHASFTGTASNRYVEVTWNTSLRHLVLTARLSTNTADLTPASGAR